MNRRTRPPRRPDSNGDRRHDNHDSQPHHGNQNGFGGGGGGERRHRDGPPQQQHREGRPPFNRDDNHHHRQQSGGPSEPSAESAPFGAIPGDLRVYLSSIDTNIEGFEQGEDLDILLENVWQELEGKELIVATDPGASLTLQKLINMSNATQICAFFACMEGHYVILFSHFCASHVCQAAIERSAFVLGQDMYASKIATLLSTMATQLSSHWAALATHRKGSFVVRSVLELLRDGPRDPALQRSKSAQIGSGARAHWETPTKATLPPACRTALQGAVEELQALFGPQIRAHAFDAVVNPVLQLLLEVGAAEDMVTTFLLPDDVNSDNQQAFIRNAIQHPVASRLFEKILRHCTPLQFRDVYQHYFRGHLAPYCQHQTGNFVVQALIQHVPRAELFALIVDELAPAIHDLLFRGRPLVVLRMVEKCAQFEESGRAVMKPLIAAATGGSGPVANFFPALLYLSRTAFPGSAGTGTGGGEAYAPPPPQRQRNRRHQRPTDQVQQRGGPATAGSQLIAAILNMPSNANKELVDSFLCRDMAWYFPLLRDAAGSFAVQALVASPTVNPPPKRKLLYALLNADAIASLATDKFGSHVVDALWKSADLATKEKIAAHLLAHEKALTDSHHGRFVWRNCGMQAFKGKRAEWAQKIKGAERTRDMFAEIIGGVDDTREMELLGVAAASAAADGEDADVVVPSAKTAAKPAGATGKPATDEIDALFEKKTRRGPTDADMDVGADAPEMPVVKDKSLGLVMEAITATKKRKKRSRAETADEPSVASARDDDEEVKEGRSKSKKHKSKRQFV